MKNSSDVIANHVVGDLEDFQKKRGNSEKGPRPIVRCYEVNNDQHPVKADVQANTVQHQTDHRGIAQQLSSTLQPNVLSTENVDRNVDYQGWLELKKRKWKDNLERKKRKRYFLLLLMDKDYFNSMELLNANWYSVEEIVHRSKY